MSQSVYGSPFRNDNSGISETDRENKKNLRQAVNNFFQANPEIREKSENSFCRNVATYLTFAAPLSGLVLAQFITDSYLNPRFFYLRTFLTVGSAAGGYIIGNYYKNMYETSFYTRNYQIFPKEIQDAIRSGDARYARKYLEQTE